MRPIRLVDIARQMGLSTSTVSKALSGSSEVSAATRSRVRERADQLGYRPHGAAGRQRAGATRTVGLLTHDSVGRLSTPVLLGAEDAFGAERMSVLLCDTRGDLARTRFHVQTLLEHQVDGIIVLAGDTNEQQSLDDEVPVPVVYAYGASPNASHLSLLPDEAQGARLAVEHLLALGRRRIGHISGPPHFAATQRRGDALEGVLSDKGLELATGRPWLGEWSEPWGRAGMQMLLQNCPDLDAVFCGSDVIARGALDVLRDHARRVPHDVAVVGFDNWRTIGTGSRPPLTTIDMQLESLGRAAADALSQAIAGQPRSGVERLPCRLVIRGSTVADH